jgi:NADH dehydrogenase
MTEASVQERVGTAGPEHVGRRRTRVLVVGGGYVGLYTALTLQKRLRPDEAEIVVVDPRSYMTYQPFLPEASAGSLEPRHVVVPLRRVLPRCDVITGEVTRIRHAEKVASIRTDHAEPYELSYDVLVVALGSVARTLPIPGLAENGIGFKQVEEAITLRNQVLEKLDAATSVRDPALRRRLLTFVFVGGGYAGIEALGELEDMARYATRYYDDITPADLRFVLVEATGRILPEVGEAMGRYALEELRGRGIEVRLETRLESCVDCRIVLSNGQEFEAETLVWTAGVKANPVLARTDLPLDEKGRVRTRVDLRVEGLPDAWAAGDCAAVPDLTNPGQLCGPSAQHAVRQAPRLGRNVAAVLRGGQPTSYAHRYAGSVASLGLHKGVAHVYGIKLRGWPAWFMHRSYHVSRVPTVNRKVRVVADWTLALFFRREVVSLGSLRTPREAFSTAARSPEPTRRA